MKVFLSWSGQRSENTAQTLASWLRQVVQAVEPWLSTDIKKGVRWGPEISDQLEQSKVGIICLTSENLHEDWILFEAGALSKTKDAHVCTFLLDVGPADIEQPLAQFQHTRFEKEEVRKLIHTIKDVANRAGEKTPPDQDLDKLFNVLWPELEGKLKEICTQVQQSGQPVRSDRQILEEILEAVRALQSVQMIAGMKSLGEPNPFRLLRAGPLSASKDVAQEMWRDTLTDYLARFADQTEKTDALVDYVARRAAERMIKTRVSEREKNNTITDVSG